MAVGLRGSGHGHGGGGAKGRKVTTAFTFITGVLVGLSLALLVPIFYHHDATNPWPHYSRASLARPEPSPCICPSGPAQTQQQQQQEEEEDKEKEGLNTQEGGGILTKEAQAKLLNQAKYSGIHMIDGKEVFQEFLSYLPQFQVHRKGLLITAQNSAFTLPKKHTNPYEIPTDSLRTCREVDVLLTAVGRCYAVVSTNLMHTSYFIQRYQLDEASHSWKMVPRIKKEGSFPPLPVNRKKHEIFLATLFAQLQSLEEEADKVLRQAAEGNDRRVLLMCLNQGDVDMLINFICSARHAGLDLSNLVVFGADQTVAEIAQSFGLHGFSHPALGNLPRKHAEHYGDGPFMAMMWLKIVSVWISIRLGYHVLFQDADLVWFRDPWPVFADQSIDGFFMDDGARSERFSPLWANSGFYFLRSNPLVTHVMQTLLFSYDMMVQYASHQTVFIQVLQEHISRNGLRIKLLDETEFMGGKTFHHDKELMGKVSSRQYVPYTFHMCWSQTKKEKLQYIKEGRLWYVTPGCSDYGDIEKLLRQKQLSYDSCCQAPWGGPEEEKKEAAPK